MPHPCCFAVSSSGLKVKTISESRFDKNMYNSFLVCGATTRVAAFLSREVVTMKGLAELAHGGGSNAEKWIAGVAKRLNTGESTVITPVRINGFTY